MMDLADLLTPDAISQRIAFHKRLVDEEAAANALCQRLLTGPARWWGNALRNAEGSRTAGMVTVLIERAAETGQHSPAKALLVAELAGQVAAFIGIDDYPYDHVLKIRGQAFRTIAWWLSVLARFDEASVNVQRSHELLEKIPVPDLELARLDLVRSNIARYVDKHDEAIECARRAGETFLWFGSRSGWVKACHYEAAAHYGCHDYVRALEVWEGIAEYLDSADTLGRAQLLHNKAMCHRELGRLEQAEKAFCEAAEVYRSLGMDVDHLKCLFSLGITLTMQAKYEMAIRMLRTSFKEADALGMGADALLVGLRLVEALLLANQEKEVPAICRDLVERCTRAGMKSNAMTALSYLREALATGHATPDLVRHVYSFMRDTALREKRLVVEVQ
jgi:tetratricopeptide (TPR) repeat protein